MSVVGYVFQSATDPDIPDDDMQQAALEKYARQLGEEIDYYCYDRDVSLRKPLRKRRAGAELLGGLQEGDILLAGKAEWVLSSAKEGERLLSQLEKKKVALHCLDLDANISLPETRKLMVSDGQAAFTRKLLQSLAVCERNKHGEAIRAAKQGMLKEGKYIGGPVPFGWQVKEGFLIRDKEQQRIVRQMRKWRQDRYSYRDIVIKLQESFGLKMSHEGVRKLLMNSTDRKIDGSGIVTKKEDSV